MVIITHDLGVVAELANDSLVMYSGRVSEYGCAEDIFWRPGHPYTWGLLTLDAAYRGQQRSERLIPIQGARSSTARRPQL